jgi:hypothetical protein
LCIVQKRDVVDPLVLGSPFDVGIGENLLLASPDIIIHLKVTHQGEERVFECSRSVLLEEKVANPSTERNESVSHCVAMCHAPEARKAFLTSGLPRRHDISQDITQDAQK